MPFQVCRRESHKECENAKLFHSRQQFKHGLFANMEKILSLFVKTEMLGFGQE